MIERERKYLIKTLPNHLENYPCRHIQQGYFTADEGDTSDPLRIRGDNGRYELTKKFMLEPGNFSTVHEVTITISEQEFQALWPVARYRIQKDRYELPLEAGLIAELDIFHGELEGFIQVEVEFPDAETEQQFQPPIWFGADITTQKWAWNPYYATIDWPQLQKLIHQLDPS